MSALKDKHVLLGVTGGIAAYKSAELVRCLQRAGAEVRVVMTQGAMEFITPLTLQALSGHPVRTELLDSEAESGMDHIALARWADIILAAPASANFMSRLSEGRADDLLATLCLATSAPIVLAPAMNQQMWLAEATQYNVQVLTGRGIRLFGPAAGEQACGEVGPGRMLEPEQIARQVEALFAEGPLTGLTVMVTAGPTREAIDPVRYISNRSSGKMGFAVAQAAAEAGARVVLISGPVSIATPPGVERVDIETAEQALAAVQVHECDIFIATAAISDYRPVLEHQQKIKKDQSGLVLELERTTDILATVASAEKTPFTVGFAAETENLDDYALSKLEAKGLDMIAANWVGENTEGGFDRETNALKLFWKGESKELPMTSKRELARKLIGVVTERYRQKHQ
ncbi:MAG: bifunctional phosphopantothenoylcysteine decarboxylase/phosphopantothenate--cysteine ligase CoaBC [Gammaproteobacteria bacterium]|nr:bifunctional phosphopantothenoylcysteine decarboxylase/phosphopantothenate--cysteine ligase CoaBC [Gammaproteobacteria bacterium]